MTADSEVLGREEFVEITDDLHEMAPPTSASIRAGDLTNRLLRHDAALRARIEALEAERERLKGLLHREDSSEDGAGLIPAVEWMLDIIEMYEGRLIEFGDPPELVHSDVNEACKEKTKRDLRIARRALEESDAS